MDKIKPYLYLLIVLLSTFLLGAYTFSTVYEIREVPTQSWIATSLIGAIHLIFLYKEFKRK